MRRSCLAIAALCVGFSCGVTLAAEKPARRARPDDRNRACAAQGEGFVYSRETNSCIRVGGAVSNEFSGGTPAYGR